MSSFNIHLGIEDLPDGQVAEARLSPSGDQKHISASIPSILLTQTSRLRILLEEIDS